MKRVAVFNQNKPQTCLVIAAFCDSFLPRLRGFTFRRAIPKDEGLVLVQSRDSRVDSSIHMLFCFTDLAVVWINDAGQVVDTVLARAWRPAYFPKKPARFVLEMNPARLAEFNVGDQVRFEQVWVD